MEVIVTPAVVLGAIMGLVQAAKLLGMSSRIAPAVAIVIGTSYSLFHNGLTVESAVVGVVIGLAASGMWDLGKNTVLGK